MFCVFSCCYATITVFLFFKSTFIFHTINGSIGEILEDNECVTESKVYSKWFQLETTGVQKAKFNAFLIRNTIFSLV
jgi:hypothetical protein